MTPRKLDWQAVEPKLAQRRRLLDQLRDLGESPPDYTESFNAAARAGLITDELPKVLAASAGTRNVLVHAYLDVDYAQVADSIPLALRYYRDYIRQAAGWLRDRAD